MDQTKQLVADCRHRMLLHNHWGVYVALKRFGSYYPCSNGAVPVSDLANDHIREDMGEIPDLEKSLKDCTFKVARPLSAFSHVEADFASYRLESPDDYDKLTALHNFLDSPIQEFWANDVALALTHNSFGPFLAESIFGTVITSKEIPTRYLVERHILAECRGKIHSIEQVFEGMEVLGWMCKNAKRLSEKYANSNNER